MHLITKLKETISLHRSVTRLKAVILDPHCKRMNKSSVVGFLGEVVVRQKLEMEGLQVEHHGNQTGYDLEVHGGPKIDVKACTPRSYFGDSANCWGWALLSKSKKRKISFQYLVCVAFNSSLNVSAFYVVNTKDLRKFPESSARFRGVLRAFNIFENVPKLSKTSPWFRVRRECEKAVRLGYAKKVKPNEKLSKHLRLSKTQ
jgi:hypothetical protein